MPQPFDSLKGFAVTFRQMFKKPITQQYPSTSARVSALPRSSSPLAPRERT